MMIPGQFFGGGSPTFREGPYPMPSGGMPTPMPRPQVPGYGGPTQEAPGLAQLFQLLAQQQGGGQMQSPAGGPMPGGYKGGGAGPMQGSGMSPQLMQMFQMFQNPQMMQFFRQMMMQRGGGGGPMMGGPAIPPGAQGGPTGGQTPYAPPSTLPAGVPQATPTGAPGGIRAGSWMNSLFPGGGPNLPAGGGPTTPPNVSSMGNASNMTYTPR